MEPHQAVLDMSLVIGDGRSSLKVEEIFALSPAK